MSGSEHGQASKKYLVIVVALFLVSSYNKAPKQNGASPFALVALLLIFWIRRKFINYTKWWDSLTDEERAEIEQDYSEAYQVDPCLIVGERYAYIAQIGRPIAYEEIMGIYFRRSKNWSWVMNVTLNSIRTLSAYIPRTSDRDAIWEALSERCNFSGGIDSVLHL